MIRSISTILVTGLIAGAVGTAWAQSSPIPDRRVPGFGGTDTRPGMPGGSPAGSGSGVGSNVGAGASASPVIDDYRPLAETAESPSSRPLIGLSRDLPPR